MNMELQRTKTRSGRRPTLLIGVLVAIGALALPTMVIARGESDVLAAFTDLFSDVPTAHPFHAQINAIARAGITTGCAAGLYCPNDNVTRAQMAGFMHRGFGRVTRRTLSPVPVTTSLTSIGSVAITPGLPAGTVAGAAGFIQADGFVQINGNTAGCPCVIQSFARLDGSPMTSRTSIATLPAMGTGAWYTLPISGVIAVTTDGPKTVDVTIQQFSGTGSFTVTAELVASYIPLGGTGTNVLDSEPAGPSGAAGPGTVPEN